MMSDETKMTPEQAFESLTQLAHEKHPGAYVHRDRAEQRHGFLRVPVYLPEPDAWTNAGELQELEMEWNNQHRDQGVQIHITPSGVCPDHAA